MGQRKRDRRVIVAFCAGMDRGEGGEEVVRERAINFETDQGHRGAEVLQRSWELLFLHLCCSILAPHWFRLIG